MQDEIEDSVTKGSKKSDGAAGTAVGDSVTKGSKKSDGVAGTAVGDSVTKGKAGAAEKVM